MSLTLTLDKFDCEGDPTSVGVRWERWKRALYIYLEASNIEKDQKKRASLLHFGGLELQEVFYNIPGADVAAADDVDVFEVAISKLDAYFAPKQSKVYERHIFRLLKQEPNEKFEKFVVRLRQQADKCQFKDRDENIIDQVTEKCFLKELRKKILQIGDDITLDRVIMEANTLESVNKQLGEFGNTTQGNEVQVNEIERKTRKVFNRNIKEQGCGRCGNIKHTSMSMECPARNKDCLKCGLKGHFRQYCRTRQTYKRKIDGEEKTQNTYKQKRSHIASNKSGVNQVRDLEMPEEKRETEYVFHIDDDVEFDCTIGGIKTKVLVDSGCKQNLITEETWEAMKEKKVCVYNQKANTDIKFMAYGSDKPLKIKGSFEAHIQIGKKSENSTFYVIVDGTRNLLGKTTAMSLGILKIGLNLDDINQVEIKTFPKFKGVLINLPIDDSIPPVSQPYRYYR